MRLQLALNVPDIDAAVAHYSKLFGVEPHKRREGYANFTIDQPSLKLVLFENPNATSHLNHLGVEVFNDVELQTASQRLNDADILDTVESETTCCHASQNKIWSRAHNGLSWEWYHILNDETEIADDSLGRSCCTGNQMSNNMGPNCAGGLAN